MGALALIGSVVGTGLSNLFDLLDRDPSLTGRTDLWNYVIDAVRERPVFGWGYMAFWTPDSTSATYIQNQIRWPAPNAHNGYLELALGLGLVGVAGFAGTALWTARRIVTTAANNSDLAAMLTIISLQMLVANLTESFMISASVFGWNVFSIIVLMTALPRDRRSPAETTVPESLLNRAKPKG
jgi:O-antigen ligase